ncbi:SAV_2336 N-terminal domain-related protein [Streptomyces sp. NPDC086549]|uniref:SAV_2336 N-terminal domain-related protein n=1 Tax=Streptomyces sp. NPDC086549 TaxID=3365752 RepID=UPI0037F3BE07
MPSERSGTPEPLARLADVLAAAAGGMRPTPLELAELLWLARQMEPEPGSPDPRPESAAGQEPAGAPSSPSTPDQGQDRDRNQDLDQDGGRGQDQEPCPPPGTPRATLHLPSPAPEPSAPVAPHVSLLAPAPSMLRRPLALQRSLRPLNRLTDAPLGRELDEAATADRIARLGAAPEWWLPVLRPARERWLRLNLVYDDGPTMPVWRPLVRELHTALAQSGVFRTVALYRAGPEGSVHGHGALIPADRRTVTLLISDCMGPQWRQGPVGALWYATLRRWAHRMPLAVVQPLPEHLWRTTALPAAPGLFSAPFPAAPAARLAFSPYDTPVTDEGEDAVPLPVLEPGPRWLANWAGLLAGFGGSQFPGAAARLGGPPVPDDTEDRTDVARLSAEDLVIRFRATVSPEAFRLAGHLAVGRPDLPVMRLVQAAVEPRPRPQHLAEVILSGLLTSVPGPPGSYRFRPGVQELLLRGLPRTSRMRTAELMARVGGLIEERAGSAPGEFRAVTPAAGGTESAATREAFGIVRPEVVPRLSASGAAAGALPPGLRGRYRPVRRLTGPLSPTGPLWLAEDTEASRLVALRLHAALPDPARREAFLRDAQALKEIRHPNVVTVHDTGIENDVPYVVMEHLDGIGLDSLAAPNGHHLPAPLLVSIGVQLAQAFQAVHEAGITHGGVAMSRVVLLPDGSAKLSLFEPGRSPGPAGEADDLRALSAVLARLASGNSRPSLPLAPDRLGQLPASLREPYAYTLNLLMSRSAQERAQGRDLLSDAQLVTPVARAAYEQRRYYVLDGLRAEVPGGSPEFSPLAAAVLAMLLIRPGRMMSDADLRAGLWEQAEAPRDAAAVLDAIVAELRVALGPGVLASGADGCALYTGADYVDLEHSGDLDRKAVVLAARARRSHGERRLRSFHEAYDLINQALNLWHDTEALPDVPGPAARAARAQLLQLRLSLLRRRAELDLELRRFVSASQYLTELLRTYPFREDYRRLLVLALRGQGRVEKALEVCEEYELSGGRSPELLTLAQELREEYGRGPQGTVGSDDPEADTGPSAAPGTPAAQETPADLRTVAYYDFADGPQDPDTRAALGRAVSRMLTASGLDPEEYELLVRDDGCTVVTGEGVSALPLLLATARQFTQRLVELGGIRLRVAFWCLRDAGRVVERPDEEAVRKALAASDARGIVAVPPSLRAAVEASAFPMVLEPLTDEPADGSYRLAFVARDIYDGTSPRPPVQGPFPLPPRAVLPEPAGETRTVVYRTRDDELGLTRTQDTVGYFEVDLTLHRVELDSARPSADGGYVFRVRGDASWRIADPVEATVHGGGRTPSALVQERAEACLDEVTLNFPPSRAAQARAAFDDALVRGAVPGCVVLWDVTLTTTPSSRSGPPARRHRSKVAGSVRAAEAVVFGFDGTLARLYPGNGAAGVARDLARLLMDEVLEPCPHPLALLRAFEQHEAALRSRLAEVETAAARSAEPVPHADLLVRTLADKGVPLAVVTDCAPRAATAYLVGRGLTDCLPGGVHGRDDGHSRLMPSPDAVLSAAAGLGVRPGDCLVVGSTDAEWEAARAAGAEFVYLTARPERLGEDPVLTTVGLGSLLHGARSR